MNNNEFDMNAIIHIIVEFGYSFAKEMALGRGVRQDARQDARMAFK